MCRVNKKDKGPGQGWTINKEDAEVSEGVDSDQERQGASGGVERKWGGQSPQMLNWE